MSEQYDNIAKQYRNSKKRIFYKITDYSIKNKLGDISGLDILDLACGEGYITRQLKNLGAKNVIGVDISSEMIKLAKKQEQNKPKGIKYICSPVQDLGKIGKFDIITGVFLLHYATSKKELFAFCKTISDNLKPDGRFIGANSLGIKKRLYNNFKNYDVEYIIPTKIQDGQKFKLVVNYGWQKIEIAMYHYSRKLYNEILKKSGFRKIKWSNFIIPPEIVQNKQAGHWKIFDKIAYEGILCCTK